jgi:hypothetical protein
MGLALITTILASLRLDTCGPPTSLGLVLLEIPTSAPCDLAHMQKMATIT